MGLLSTPELTRAVACRAVHVIITPAGPEEWILAFESVTWVPLQTDPYARGAQGHTKTVEKGGVAGVGKLRHDAAIALTVLAGSVGIEGGVAKKESAPSWGRAPQTDAVGSGGWRHHLALGAKAHAGTEAV